MQKFTWLDAHDETALEAELDALEQDQAFLEHFYGVTMLLDAIDHADSEAEYDEFDESIAS
ncbi:hypothetical protein D3C72_464050 [compost metagenome]